ncbi:MAG: hypothetical protein M0P00_07955 [Bacteroidaceae bacterium]|nr:hypothetical protein [Bacteroidaceae bacterium]
MKNKIKYIILGSLLFSASGIAPKVFAQGDKSRTAAALDLTKDKSSWMQSANASGLIFEDHETYNDLNIGYKWNKGIFRRPQQGEKNNNLFINTEGAINLGKTYVWGKFAFTKEKVTGSDYNASIIDPYRGMPYYVADTNISDWKNQFYDLDFKVATPITKSLSIGLSGSYKAQLGAKQRDPRTENRLMYLDLKPGVTYAFNEHHHLGVNLEYFSLKEESNMTNINDYVDQTYYALYGLGTSVKGLGAGRTTNYEGNDVGGALQYFYSNCGVKFIMQGSINAKVEDANVSFSTPKKEGTVKDWVRTGMASLHLDRPKYLHMISVDFLSRSIDGIQYINQRDNTESLSGWMDLYSNIRSTYETNTLNAEYALYKKRGSEYTWNVHAALKYNRQNDEYIMPHSELKYENMIVAVGGKLNIKACDKLSKRVLLTADVNYSSNLSGIYKYGGANADSPIVTDFMQRDFNYLTSDSYGVRASAKYSQKIKENDSYQVYAGGTFNWTKARDYNYGHRTVAELNFGFIF